MFVRLSPLRGAVVSVDRPLERLVDRPEDMAAGRGPKYVLVP